MSSMRTCRQVSPVTVFECEDRGLEDFDSQVIAVCGGCLVDIGFFARRYTAIQLVK